MELKPIKVELFPEDKQPEFNIDDIEAENNTHKNDSTVLETPSKKRQGLMSSKLSQISNAAQSYTSSIMYSRQKDILDELKKKHTAHQSISPVKAAFRNKFVGKRPMSSVNKNDNSKAITRAEQTSERSSYSPTLSPQRKCTYWQAWLLPMNSTMKQTVTQQPPKITAQSYCVMTTDTNQIIACQNANIERQIASLTKLMTAYTALNICSTFGIKIREHYVSINKHAAYMNGTSAGLKADEEILIIDLLYALLLPSGNDAGIAIAQFFGKFLSYKYAKEMGSNQKEKTSMDKFRQFKDFYDTEYDKESLKLFIFQMNKNAHKIGLKKTHFNNPTGLSDKLNYSSARDMAHFTCHCLQNHTLRLIFKKKFHSCEVRNIKMSQSRQIDWKNTNRHLFQFRQCIGVKTGITPNAGPCLSSAYKVMGREVVVIVLQCQSLQARYKDAEALFKWCRKKIRTF